MHTTDKSDSASKPALIAADRLDLQSTTSIDALAERKLEQPVADEIRAESIPTSDIASSVMAALTEQGIVQTPDGLVLKEAGAETLVTNYFAVRGVSNDDGTSAGIVLMTEPLPGQRVVHPIPNKDVLSPTKLKAHLATLGILRSTKTKVANAVMDYIFALAPLQRVRLVRREGIVKLDGGRVIAVFQGHVTAGDGSDVIVMRPRDSVFSRGGTEQGQQALLRLAMKGNPFVIVAMSLGPVSALGQIVDIAAPSLCYIGDSSGGKSTVGRALVSQYGHLKYLITWDATLNGFEAQVLKHTGVVPVFDEFGTGTGATVYAGIYRMSGSMTRSRMTTSGELQTQQVVQGTFYATGEVTPKTHAKAAGRRMKTGHDARMVTILLKPGQTMFDEVPPNFAGQKEFADYLAAEAAIHYGHFAPALMNALVENVEEVRKELPSLRMDVEVQIRAAHEIPALRQVEARVFDGFVNMGVAATLASRYGVFPISVTEVMHALGHVFLHWLEGLRDVPEYTGEHVRDWLRQSLHQFDEIANWRTPKARAGFVLHHPTEGVLYLVHKKYFADVVCKGMDVQLQLRGLRDAGLLATHSHNLTWGQRMPGAGAEGGAIPFYAIRAAALFEAQD